MCCFEKKRTGYVLLLLLAWMVSVGIWLRGIIQEDERFRLRHTHSQHAGTAVAVGLSDHNRSHDDRYVLFSSMDSGYQAKYAQYLEINRNYSVRHGYRFLYAPEDLGMIGMRRNMVAAHYNRIYAARNLLHGRFRASASSTTPSTPSTSLTQTTATTTTPAEWLVYIDADAFIAETMPLSVLTQLAAERYEGCEFIAQDYPHIVNSGFWLLKNTSWAREFVENWMRESEKELADGFVWVSDQGPLQNSILHVSSLSSLW